MQQRKNKVLSRGFKMLNEDGSENEEATKLLKAEWFEIFVSCALDSRFYGFSLLEFDSLIDDKFKEVREVPREYVVPEKGKVRTTLNGGTYIDYTKPPFANWVLFVGSKTDLGLLNKVTPVVQWKRLVQATWAEYNELYGIPLRVGRTDTRDPEARNNMAQMLDQLGSSAWGLFDEDDNIEIISGNSSGNHNTFKDFIDLADEQISKLILGQTMTTDDGSSRSQAEVHAEILESYTGADLRWLEHLINNKLLPFCENLGLTFGGAMFSWDNSEKLSLSEQFEIDKELLNFYKLPAEYITAKYGTPVEEMEANDNPQPANGVTIMNDVASLYKDFFKHGDGCTCGSC
jgi:phage gp29-like protein